MINLLVKTSVERLIRKGIIDESERELYCFGANGLYCFLINIITSMAIGALFGMLWQSLLFSAAYIPLRSYVGGYHAKTPGMCYFLSTLLIARVLVVLKYVPFSTDGMYIDLVVSTAVIFLKAPVESENKPLSARERQEYGRKAKGIALIELLICVIACNLFPDGVECVVAAICGSSLLLVFKILDENKINFRRW